MHGCYLISQSDPPPGSVLLACVLPPFTLTTRFEQESIIHSPCIHLHGYMDGSAQLIRGSGW
eukprot:COSAG06_NODE_61787_length_266_cov_1.862275_1_plen_61_part_01